MERHETEAIVQTLRELQQALEVLLATYPKGPARDFIEFSLRAPMRRLSETCQYESP